jgi:hypothetical protein
MRRHTILAWLTLLVTLPAARADLRCDQPIVDAGRVRNGETLSRRFTFINRSLVPIEITDVQTTCGCLKPTLTKRVFQPGEQGEVVLEVRTLALSQGRQSWRARLSYRDAASVGELELSIVGDVQTEVLVQPAALVLPAEIGSHEITVTDLRARQLTVTGADAGGRLGAKVAGMRIDELGRHVQAVRLEVPADWPEGRHELLVHVYTNDPDYRELTVPVTVVKKSRSHVGASPSEVTLSGERGQPFPSRLVRLSAADGQEVEITAVDSDQPAVRATFAKGPAAAATVRVQVDATSLAGDLHATLRVHIARPAAEDVTVPVTVLVK